MNDCVTKTAEIVSCGQLCRLGSSFFCGSGVCHINIEKKKKKKKVSKLVFHAQSTKKAKKKKKKKKKKPNPFKQK